MTATPTGDESLLLSSSSHSHVVLTRFSLELRRYATCEAPGYYHSKVTGAICPFISHFAAPGYLHSQRDAAFGRRDRRAPDTKSTDRFVPCHDLRDGALFCANDKPCSPI